MHFGRVMVLIAAAVLQVRGAKEGLRKVVLENHCDNPMELTVLPDGRVLFVERFGLARIWKPDTKTTVVAAKFAVHGALNPSTKKDPDHGSWEAGLIGVTASPDFVKTGWIYVYYSPAGDVAENRLSRFTLHGDEIDLSSEKVVLRVAVQREVCCHEGGSLAFDGEGNLFLSTGDNTNPFASDGYSPTDFREGRNAWDAGRSSGNANDLRGKILRLHPETDGSYTSPTGNLFPPGTPKTRPEIFAMGCRNPFRISVDKVTGTLSWGDVGPDARESNPERGPAGFDEVNRTRTAGNFGWPFFVADNKPYRHYDFEAKESSDAYDPIHPVNPSPTNDGPRELPAAQPAWMYYPYGPSTRFPMAGSGPRTACAGPVYRFDPELASPRKLPAKYDQCFFVFEWARNWIVAVKLDESGKAARLERFAPDIELKRPIELELDPDGALYGIEFGTAWENNKDSLVFRIEAVSETH